MGQNFSTLKPPNVWTKYSFGWYLKLRKRSWTGSERVLHDCYDPPQFFSSIPVAPATAPPAVHAPAPPPAVQPIPAQPVAPPQPYIRTRPLSPMQVDPANVPLPTPSTDSDMLPPDVMILGLVGPLFFISLAPSFLINPSWSLPF